MNICVHSNGQGARDVDAGPQGGGGERAGSEKDRRAAINMLPNADLANHTCDSCSKDITGLCYIRCEECKQEVDLCAACFFAGMEPLGHKKTHSYRVMDKLDKPIFTEDWTAAEELSLMDQVKKMGLGAWEEISDSKLFYRRHSSSELNARYLDTYLSQYGSVLPPCYLKHRPDGSGADKFPIPLTHPANCPPNQRGVKVNSKEIRGRTIAELGTNPRYRYEPSWQALAEKQNQRKEESEAAAAGAASANGSSTAAAKGTIGAPNGVGGGVVGFACAGNGAVGGDGAGSATGQQNRSNTKQRRRRADKVNKAKEEEREIREWTEKLPGADLSVYAPLRGDFDHEHDDTAEEASLLANMEFRPTDHASEKQLKLDVIAVYNHRLDEREKRKKFVIENNLLDYKKPPPGSKKRGREDRELVARLRPFARFSSAKEHDELIDNLIAAKKIRARIETLQMYRQNGITTIAEGIEFDKARQRRQEELASQKHRESASYLYDGHASAKGNTGDRNRRYKDRNKGGGMSDGNGDDGRNGNNLLDVEGAPGVEYLSPAERALCSQLHLLPGYYLVIKNAMIQECVKSGCLKKSNLAGLATLDKPRLDKMYDFFSTSGWVTEKHRDFEVTGAAANAIPGSPPA
ncbi:unnamed protein product [Ectocarpus sp. 12 AP-2014]